MSGDPTCDGDGYIETWNDDQSGVVTALCPGCPECLAATTRCPGMGIDDLCTWPDVEGCGLCIIGKNPVLYG